MGTWFLFVITVKLYSTEDGEAEITSEFRERLDEDHKEPITPHMLVIIMISFFFLHDFSYIYHLIVSCMLVGYAKWTLSRCTEFFKS